MTVAVLHLLAVASPGPDFALVLRQSLARGRKAALYSSLGIALGILLHTGYSTLGVALAITHFEGLFSLMKIAGAGYLLYLGLSFIRSWIRGWMRRGFSTGTGAPSAAVGSPGEATPAGEVLRPLYQGLLVNALNPKAALFFLAIYSTVLNPATGTIARALYGLYMALATGLWFALVSLLLGGAGARRFFSQSLHWLDLAVGALLIFLGGQLLVSELPADAEHFLRGAGR